MKYIISLLFLMGMVGCAGKQLMKNCHTVGMSDAGHVLSECDHL